MKKPSSDSSPEPRPLAVRISGDPASDALLESILPPMEWDIHTVKGPLTREGMAVGATCLIVDVRSASDCPRVLDAVARYPGLPIIVLADDAQAEPIEALLAHKVSDILRTPLHSLDLRMAARRCLKANDYRRRLPPISDENVASAADRGSANGNADRRFDTAFQMMSRIGSLIGRLARDVRGDVRYFDELSYFVSVHDAACRLVGANAVYREQFGDSLLRPSWKIYSGERAHRQTCPEGKVIDTGDKVSMDAVVRYRSGAKVPVRVHAAPIFDASGNVDMVLEVFAGVQEIDRLATDIRSTQRRYRQLFDAVPNYIVVLDRKVRLTAFNSRFMQDFGLKTGRRFYDLFKPVTPAREGTPIDLTFKDGMPHQGEMLLRSPNGEQLTLLAWTSPLKTAAGKLLEVLTIFTDLTELRRLQDNLSQLGLMISTISHSLKGSLTGMDAALYLIDKGFYRERPGRIEEGLELATLMSDRIRKLVRDILYYAKERELETENTDVEGFALDIADSVRGRILGANIHFQPNIAPGAGTFDIDSGLMRSALINLLDNAVEACIEDDTSLAQHVITFTVKGDEQSVFFVVSDNGGGMTADEMKNMFQLFWSSKGAKGTGLGLFITRKVIQQHGGTINTSSQPGSGAVFTAQLPRRHP